jgi:hypothetical protein
LESLWQIFEKAVHGPGARVNRKNTEIRIGTLLQLRRVRLSTGVLVERLFNLTPSISE